VRERAENDLVRRGTVERSWLELELCAGADTRALERLLTHERERPAPESSFLGVRSRTRFGHVPVFVARPGVVRVEWLGARVLRALERHLAIGEPRRHDLALGPDGASPADLDARLRQLCLRGQRIGAVALARRELGLSLAAARAHVERVAGEAA
jgi:hypothetical protein